MSKYVPVRDRPRPITHPGTGGWDYFHWRYGKRFYRGCRVRVKAGPGMDRYSGKLGTVTSCYTGIYVKLDQWPFEGKPRNTRRFLFHPSDLEIVEDQP